jgi:hypothetical protein
MVISFNDSHLQNASLPILVTLSGIVISFNDLQPTNANSPILVGLTSTNLPSFNVTNLLSTKAVLSSILINV